MWGHVPPASSMALVPMCTACVRLLVELTDNIEYMSCMCLLYVDAEQDGIVGGATYEVR